MNEFGKHESCGLAHPFDNVGRYLNHLQHTARDLRRGQECWRLDGIHQTGRSAAAHPPVVHSACKAYRRMLSSEYYRQTVCWAACVHVHTENWCERRTHRRNKYIPRRWSGSKYLRHVRTLREVRSAGRPESGAQEPPCITQRTIVEHAALWILPAHSCTSKVPASRTPRPAHRSVYTRVYANCETQCELSTKLANCESRTLPACLPIWCSQASAKFSIPKVLSLKMHLLQPKTNGVQFTKKMILASNKKSQRIVTCQQDENRLQWSDLQR